MSRKIVAAFYAYCVDPYAVTRGAPANHRGLFFIPFSFLKLNRCPMCCTASTPAMPLAGERNSNAVFPRGSLLGLSLNTRITSPAPLCAALTCQRFVREVLQE